MKGRTLDQLIVVLGTRNRFQAFILILAGFNYLPLVFNHVIMAFFGAAPPHRCNLTSQYESNGAGDGNAVGLMDRYHNTTVLAEEGDRCVTRLYLATGVNTTVKCPAGSWQYTPPHGEKTIVSEWDLVCDNKYLASLATTIYFSGVMVGGLLFGFLSDFVGRLPILLFTLYLPVAVGVGTAFAHSYVLFVTLRFIQGVLMQGLQTSSYVLAMEFFIPAQRPMVGAVMECFWGATVMLLPGLAYLLPNWRHLQLAISLPSILAVFYICVMPESLRWLVMKGKLDRGEQLVRRITKFNRLSFPKELWEVIQKEASDSAESSARQYHFLHLFRTPMLRRRSLVLFYIWLTIATCYYGLTFKITSLPGNKYLNFFIGGAVEVVAYASSMWVMSKLGRKTPLLVCFLSAGVCCIIAASIPHITTDSGLRLEHISTAFAIVGRFFMAGLFSVIFVYTTELYPTVIRNIGMGTCLFWARLGGVIAPQINRLGIGAVVLVPILVFGCMMLLGGALLLLLPETHGHKLPDTIDDVEQPLPDANSILGPTPYVEQELMVKTGDQSEAGNENAV